MLSSKLNQWAHNTYVNIGVVVAFTLFAGIGYMQLGETFLTEWAGGVAAAISIACLIFKSQGLLGLEHRQCGTVVYPIPQFQSAYVGGTTSDVRSVQPIWFDHLGNSA
jgi:hypothetical protein